jgi:hypothetical protein
MALKYPQAHEKWVASYQLSGRPYVTGSSSAGELTTTAVEFRFPQVTRWLQINNTGAAALRIGFSKSGVNASDEAGNNYYIVPTADAGDSAQAPVWELRCETVWLRSDSGTTDFTLIAGLTDIANLSIPLTGSKGIG